MTKKDIFGIRYTSKESEDAIRGLLEAFNVLGVECKNNPDGERVIEFDQPEKGFVDSILYTIYKRDWLVLNKVTNKFCCLAHKQYIALMNHLPNES